MDSLVEEIVFVDARSATARSRNPLQVPGASEWDFTDGLIQPSVVAVKGNSTPLRWAAASRAESNSRTRSVGVENPVCAQMIFTFGLCAKR